MNAEDLILAINEAGIPVFPERYSTGRVTKSYRTIWHIRLIDEWGTDRMDSVCGKVRYHEVEMPRRFPPAVSALCPQCYTKTEGAGQILKDLNGFFGSLKEDSQ